MNFILSCFSFLCIILDCTAGFFCFKFYLKIKFLKSFQIKEAHRVISYNIFCRKRRIVSVSDNTLVISLVSLLFKIELQENVIENDGRLTFNL